MKSRSKGQALVEFILIVPIIIMIILVIIDVGRIYNTKSDVEDKLDKTVEFIKDGYDYSEDDEITYEYYGTKSKVTITRRINLITPGIGFFVDNPYKVESSRVLYNE